MTLYLSRAMITIVQIDVTPNIDPMTPYRVQAAGPMKKIDLTRIHSSDGLIFSSLYTSYQNSIAHEYC